MDPATDSDEILFERYVREGERAAFEELFRRYASRLTGFFRRAGCSEAVAHDMVQQTFLHVHRARNDFRMGARLRPWVFAIALNVRREHFRRKARKPETQWDDTIHPTPISRPDATTAEQRAVRRALEQLSDAHREVILLHWYEGLSFPEVAEIVGASTSAVKVRAHRGYQKLRTILGGDA